MKKIIHIFVSMSRLKKIALELFLLLAIGILLISGVVATDSGSRWVVQRVASVFNIRLGFVAGNLLAGLDIASMDMQQSDLQIHAEKMQFRWQPLALF